MQQTTQPTWFNLGIRGRLLIGFSIVAIISLLAIAITLSAVQTTSSYATRLVNADFPFYDRMLDVDGQLYLAQSSLRAWLLTKNEKYITEMNNAWNNIRKDQSQINDVLQGISNNKIQSDWQIISTLLVQLQQEEVNVYNSNPTINQSTNINLLMSKVDGLQNKVLDILDGPMNASGERVGGLFDSQYATVHNGALNLLSDLSNIRLIEYALLITILLFSIIIAFVTANKILVPLQDAIEIAQRIAANERNIKISVSSNDETGQLLTALSTMQEAIAKNEDEIRKSEARSRELFENISNTAKQFSIHSSNVASGDLTKRLTLPDDKAMSQLGNDLNLMTEGLASITKQITQACHNMVTTIEEVKHAVDVQSSGASEQASSINEITASIEEIEKSSTQTMDKAKALGETAERTREKGQQGLEAVEQSVLGMKAVREKVQLIAQTILDLSNQTQQVGEITALVNTLAQQSKMLALNASIEAAKAGEAGKGFAVVATEVKNLAEQSEQATSQVQKILEDIRHATEKAVMVTEEGTKGVDYGTSLVEQTGEVVRNLSDVIHETTIGTQQIETAIRQESVGIEQITAGMNEINQVTGSFVESAKQTTEAINNLASIAKSLKERVDTYKI